MPVKTKSTFSGLLPIQSYESEGGTASGPPSSERSDDEVAEALFPTRAGKGVAESPFGSTQSVEPAPRVGKHS